MRYSDEHKEETRRKLLNAATRRFTALGYNGLGIDGLAKEAGVSNGAFYGNFSSKAEAFRTIMIAELDNLRRGIDRHRSEYGDDWLVAFNEFYFGDEKLDDPEKTCPLPAFAPEVARAQSETRDAFQSELLRIVDAVTEGLDDDLNEMTEKDVRAQAWTILALFTGGTLLARAVPSEKLSRQITDIMRVEVIKAAGKN